MRVTSKTIEVLTGDRPTQPIMRSAVITCAGFRQKLGEMSGPALLDRRLKDMLHDRRRDHVALRTWKSDHAGTAAEVARMGCRRVVLVGYSYGCGWGVKHLAKELAALDIEVDLCVLIDPVPRTWFVPANVMAMTRAGRFHVPRNVKRVALIRQLNGRPYGRDIVVGAGTEKVLAWHYGTKAVLMKHGPAPGGVDEWKLTARAIRLGHLDIDDHPEVHREVLALVSDLLNDEGERDAA